MQDQHQKICTPSTLKRSQHTQNLKRCIFTIPQLLQLKQIQPIHVDGTLHNGEALARWPKQKKNMFKS